jgi:Zn-dependent peptidase ImmA (M78 family)
VSLKQGAGLSALQGRLPIRFVNKGMPNDRKRFTLGHELGHIVMHLRFNLEEDDKTVESQADEFSSEFNMPLLDCINDISGLRLSDLGSLKSYWMMSKSAIIRRALTAKVITAERYKYFMIELSRMGERKNERGLVALDTPTLSKQIIDLHINELNYTKEELYRMLGLYYEDCVNLFLRPNPLHMRLQIRNA